MTAHDLIEQFTQYQLELIESLKNYVEQNGGLVNLEHSYSHLVYNEEKETVILRNLQNVDEEFIVTYTINDDTKIQTSNIDQFSVDELWQIIYALNK